MEMKRAKQKYPRRLFWTIVGLLSLVSVFAGIYWGSYISAILRRDALRSEMAHSLQTLKRVQYTVDDLFRSAKYHTESTLWERDIISLLIDPDGVSTEQVSRATDLLAQCAHSNEFMSSVLLYSTFSNTVYSSMGTHVPMEYSANQALIENVLNSYANPESSCWMVTNEGKRIYVVNYIEMPQLIGIMICELNATTFGEMLQLDRDENVSRILVCQQDGTPIFPLHRQLTVTISPNQEDVFITEATDTVSLQAQWYRVQSQESNWFLLMPFQPVEGKLSFDDLALGLFPVMAVFMIVSLTIAYLVSRQIYNPVRRMIDLTLDGESQPQQLCVGQSEFDYLSLVFSDTITANRKYLEYTNRVSEDIITKIIEKIIFLPEVSENYVRDALQAMNQDAMMTGLYYLILCQFQASDDIGEFQIYMTKRALTSMISAADFPAGRKFTLFTSRNEVSIILYFPSSTSQAQAIRVRDDLVNTLSSQVSQLNCPCMFGKSTACSGIMGLQRAYPDTLETLHYKKYTVASSSTTPSKSTELEVPPDRIAIDIEQYKTQIAECINAAQQGKNAQAEHIMAGIVSYLLSNAGHAGNEVKSAQRLVAYLWETVLKMPLESDNHQQLSYLQGQIQELEYSSDLNALRSDTEAICFALLQIITKQGRKNRYKYMDEAKLYIEEHYMDSDLSLGIVSESIGISPYYLSRLFTEMTGNNFITYVNTRRLTYAKQMLELSQLSISDIGFRSGFSSVQSFCRTFKKRIGVSPGQFRSNGGKA